jgi:hypothetical protein
VEDLTPRCSRRLLDRLQILRKATLTNDRRPDRNNDQGGCDLERDKFVWRHEKIETNKNKVGKLILKAKKEHDELDAQQRTGGNGRSAAMSQKTVKVDGHLGNVGCFVLPETVHQESMVHRGGDPTCPYQH